MNILHITTYVQGGAGKIIRDLALEQRKLGHRVIVVMNEKEEEGYENYIEYINDFQKNNIEFYKINSTFKRDIYLNIIAADFVKKIIKENNIDIIHSHATTPSIIGIIAKSNEKKYIPIIQTMHGWGINKNEKHENMDRSILNLVDKVIAVSNSDKNFLINKGIDKNNIDVIYNGVKKIKEKKVKDINIDKNILNIICIGSICVRKNQIMIIEALKLMKKEKIKVYFIGEGSDADKLKLKAFEYGIYDKIEFLGYKENACEYINEFDYVILPSLSEGLPITILESYSQGKPVIVSSLEVFKEITSYEEGFIFDEKNIYSLVRVLKQAKDTLHTNKYIEMSLKAVEKYKKYFTLEKMNIEYYEKYKELKR